jgi:lauroyl/myristoyl acyltransferase
MTPEQAPNLAAALAQARRRLTAPTIPSASLRIRIKTSPLLHRLIPTRLAVSRAEARGQKLWERSSAEREHALATMEAIVEGTARAGEVTELAREHVVENEVLQALFWQPWRTAEMDAGSSARLDDALSCGRRLLLSQCHLGPIFYPMSVLAARGHITYAVAAPWFFQEPSSDYWGRRIARWRIGLFEREQRLVLSVGAFPVLEALLAEGEIVLSYFDMPGSRETHFLGKPVALATGTARLAVSTDALVLPLRARRAGHRVWVDVSAPLDPRHFAGAEQLHDALAAMYERWILETPFALEDPRRPGAWEQGATAEAWLRPEPARVSSSPARAPVDQPAHSGAARA